jgi:hypothetical protein
VTEASTCTPTSTRPAPLPAMQSRVSSTLAPAGGPRAAFSGHVRLATKPHASRTSNRECATSHAVFPTRASIALLAPPRPASQCTYHECTAVTAAPAPSCMVHSASYRSLRASECSDHSDGAWWWSARHAIRVIPHLSYPCAVLLKCRVRGIPSDGRAPSDHHTERSLQLYDSRHDRITQLVTHQQQPESQ